jgi:hypothetical protein
MIKLINESRDYFEKKQFTVPFKKYVGSHGGGCDLIYNVNTQKGYLYFDDYTVYIEISNNKVDDFAHMYYNGSTSDLDVCKKYNITDRNKLADFNDDDEYYQFFVDKGVLNNYKILNLDEDDPGTIIDMLLF